MCFVIYILLIGFVITHNLITGTQTSTRRTRKTRTGIRTSRSRITKQPPKHSSQQLAAPALLFAHRALFLPRYQRRHSRGVPKNCQISVLPMDRPRRPTPGQHGDRPPVPLRRRGCGINFRPGPYLLVSVHPGLIHVLVPTRLQSI